MSIESFEEDVTRHRRIGSSTVNDLGVIKHIRDMRNLMKPIDFDFPVYIRFCPDDVDDERMIRRADEVFGLLSAAKERNANGEDGRKLFAYRFSSKATAIAAKERS